MTAPAAAPRLSFIMPARNEARFVGQSIASIRECCPPELLAEIILVDHGSTDHTRDIAASAGAIVLQPSVQTIAALRNAGAAVATGNVFVFLDSDVTLTAAWRTAIGDVLPGVMQEPMSVSGFNCDAPESDNWFQKYWFGELAKEPNPAGIGSAHMIIPRPLFDRLGGFDASMRTGEDYDMCTRARAAGASVTPAPALRVIHHGNPVTVRAFVRRERWHGLGDVESFRHLKGSKVLWMTIAFMGLHLALIAALFVMPAAAAGALVLLLCHLYASVRVRFRWMRGQAVLVAMAIFYLYFFGRSLSFLPRRERGAR